MARPRTYHTAQDRKEAMRKARAAYYARNIDRERASARRRSQIRSQAAQSDRGTRAPSAVATLSLTATEKVLGGALCLDSRVRWGPLEAALNEDLDRWHGRADGDPRAAYLVYATTLISCKKASKRLESLQAKIHVAQGYVNAIAKIARDADGELMRRNPRGYHSRFLNLQRQAYTVDTCLDEMLMYRREGHARLEEAFNAKRLFWQGM